MTTEVAPLTARTAHATDPTFRALVDVWVSQRRCPVPLADRCLELGLDAAADCAGWAAFAPDSPPDIWDVEPHGPYPGQEASNYWWWDRSSGVRPTTAPRFVPPGRIPGHLMKPGNGGGVDTTLGAILWLLDNWVPEACQ